MSNTYVTVYTYLNNCIKTKVNKFKLYSLNFGVCGIAGFCCPKHGRPILVGCFNPDGFDTPLGGISELSPIITVIFTQTKHLNTT